MPTLLLAPTGLSETSGRESAARVSKCNSTHWPPQFQQDRSTCHPVRFCGTDRKIGMQRGRPATPHYDIPLSNTGIRSRCLAASIAYVHARCRQVHVGQNFVIFQLPGGWYRQLSFGGCRQEVQEGIEIIKRGSPCITRLGPMWWNVDPPPTLHDRLGIIYKWRMLYNGAT